VPETAPTVRGLVEELTREQGRMRALASAAIRDGDATRLRTSLALHESAAQTLVSISWQLAALAREVREARVARRLQDLRTLNDSVLDDITKLAESLYPRVLDDLGLAAAFAELARRIEASAPVRVQRNVDPTVAARLPRAAGATLYRVAEEALHNAAQHASATLVHLALRETNGRPELEVRDDGKGFDVPGAERGHLPGRGIFAMRDRLALVGGALDITSVPGSGTRLVAYIDPEVEPVRSPNG
jgi:signal transduction histidine kinase